MFHDFRYDPKDVITGAADMWAYEHLGVFGWTTEFWSPLPKAGITDYHFVNWFGEHPIADDIALLRWNDEQLGGRGFVDWYPFEHPQLGPVELGGWDWFNVWGNAPPELMEAEIAPHSDFADLHRARHPEAADPPRRRPHGRRFDLAGTGRGRERRLAPDQRHREGEARRSWSSRCTPVIALPDGARLVSGTERVDLGQLVGRSRARTMLDDFGGGSDPTRDRAKAEWYVDAAAGTDVRDHGRASARGSRARRSSRSTEVRRPAVPDSGVVTSFAETLDAASKPGPRSFGGVRASAATVALSGAPLPPRPGRDAADDLIDEVLLAVWEHLDRFRGTEGQFRSWVFTIAHNQTVDHHRRRRDEQPLDGVLAHRAADDTETEALARVSEGELRSVLAKLAPAQRQVLLLRAGLRPEHRADRGRPRSQHRGGQGPPTPRDRGRPPAHTCGLVALADKVWKARREDDLEQRLVARLVAVTGRELWDIFLELDDKLTEIAAHADERPEFQSAFPVE